ncbi:MAG: hypothetical protein K0Q59_5468 [Paenibacillus sp.]|nr:hypothetical protein [Paenibacillus sp.]
MPEESDEHAAAHIRQQLEKYRLEPVLLVSTEQLSVDQPIERTRRRMEFAKSLGIGELLSLGTSSYRMFPDIPIPEAEMNVINREFAHKFRRVAEEAERYGVRVSIKPHTGNSGSAEPLKRTIDEIGSPFIKASYDPGNVRFYEGIDPVADFPLIAGETISFVAKDHCGERGNASFPLPGQGEIDFGRLLKTLQSVHFNGPLIVERVDVPKSAQLLAEEIDERIAKARKNLIVLLERIGYRYQ